MFLRNLRRADAIYLAFLLYSEAKEEIEGRRVSHVFYFEIVSFELILWQVWCFRTFRRVDFFARFGFSFVVVGQRPM